jgi:lysophospholipase L1-like esterase
MKNKLGILTFFCFFGILRGSEKFWIQNGDDVLFWGDSITDDGIYPRIVENYILTYYPDWTVTFCNLGWGGDKSSNYPRLERDIRLCRPTKTTIMLGMNDGRYQAFNQEYLDVYVNGMHRLLDILDKHSRPDVMLISATPYDLRPRSDISRGLIAPADQLTRAFYPPVLFRYAKALQRIAEEKGCGYYNLHQDMVSLIEDLNGYDGNYQVTAEGIHPNIDGEVFMGLGILDNMMALKDVMGVWINAALGKVDSARGCTVSGLSTQGGMHFIRNDQRLPMPLYPSVREMLLRMIRYNQTWNRDWLVVTGLDSGWYDLHIDGVLVDIVPSSELKSGINLSGYGTSPMMIQAYRVFEATEKRQDAFYAKWRYRLLEGVRSPTDFTPFKEGVDTRELDQAAAEAFAEQHRLNKPGPHRFAITRTPAPDFSKIVREIPCTVFLQDRVKIRIEIDSKTLRAFEPPLCLHGNFSYASEYDWAILETKGYYSDVPARMVDDGTHGDRKAGDGIYSIDLFLRKNCGVLEFGVQDGRYVREYWNFTDPPSHRNPDIDRLTAAWGKLLRKGNEKSNRIKVETATDADLIWDAKAVKEAAF